MAGRDKFKFWWRYAQCCKHICRVISLEDKLGLSALTGADIIFRQTLIDGWYGLINSDEDPNPDYFVSLIYKKLVGRKVVDLRRACSIRKKPNLEGLRLYAHCSKNMPGSIVLFGLNVQNSTIRIKFKGLKAIRIHEYLLTPTGNNLTSTSVQLNGHHLKISRNNRYPKIKPKLRKKVIYFPALSLGFWDFAKASVKYCKTT